MSLVELTEFIVKNLVSDPDSVSVKEFEEDEYTIIELILSAEDIKKSNWKKW